MTTPPTPTPNEAAHRVARFLEAWAAGGSQSQRDQELIYGLATIKEEAHLDDPVRRLLVSDLRVLCHTAFNTPDLSFPPDTPPHPECTAKYYVHPPHMMITRADSQLGIIWEACAGLLYTAPSADPK